MHRTSAFCGDGCCSRGKSGPTRGRIFGDLLLENEIEDYSVFVLFLDCFSYVFGMCLASFLFWCANLSEFHSPI